ncbi:M81 family metallopeptidase [Synoicihabitans lomoniglobus]|uniref:M81 family metallopeptidase n=1 Tax=Synoicihabitans lomoniglobus TaxID=2909285 RepID=A0AAE9ZWC1_9BACT|nr:M81 family metallopeptidase [Opitutaceae bacterium LMO-M01]WED63713.1 M81 family metallopeptidase [Opitutaceae bacterium LMO-M01]
MSQPPRILFGGLFHETHTFLEETTTWADFDVTFDDHILGKLGDASPTDGFLSAAAAAGLTVIPTVDARAVPSGIVTDEAFETFWQEFVERARPALEQGVDGIFLVLHGAMATPSLTDAEGELLARIRALPGGETVPLFGVFDLHANLSARTCRLANGLVAYRENPHTDARASAVRATELLARALRENVIPRMAWVRLPIVWAPPGTGSADEPMVSLRRFMTELEDARPAIWATNVVPGFSFADTPDTGLSLSLVHTGEDAVMNADLRRGAELAWSKRELGEVSYASVDDVLASLPVGGPGPVVLVEPADNIGGGAPGDGTGILRALVKRDVANALVAINDPAAVATLAQTTVGAARKVSIGGKGSRLDEGPLELTVTLLSRHHGRFKLEDPNSHLASMSGLHFDMGPTAVVRAGGVTVLLTSRKTPPFDLGQWRSQGIEPKNFAVIGVKAAVAHRRAYDPIAAVSYLVDTAGPCSSNVRLFPWRHLQRPVHPLDAIAEPHFEFL